MFSSVFEYFFPSTIHMKIYGFQRMVVAFTYKPYITIKSIHHTCNGIVFDDSNYQNFGNLCVETHTSPNVVINDFPILSIQKKNENEINVINEFDCDKDHSSFCEFVDEIRKCDFETHIVYSSTFGSDHKITLNWNRDAEFSIDKRF